MKLTLIKPKPLRRRTIALGCAIVTAGALTVQPTALAFNFSGLGGLINGILQELNLGGDDADKHVQNILKWLDTVYGAYKDIQAKDLDGLIASLNDILGDLGLVDPKSAAQSVSTASVLGNPDAFIKNPDSTYGVFEMQRSADIAPSLVAQSLSQLSLGRSGQENLKRQQDSVARAASLSATGQEGATKAAVSSAESAKKSLAAANAVASKAATAQSRVASQDILKDIASQNGDIGNLLLQQSDQSLATTGHWFRHMGYRKPFCIYFRAIRSYNDLNLVALWICFYIRVPAVVVMRVASTPVIKRWLTMNDISTIALCATSISVKPLEPQSQG